MSFTQLRVILLAIATILSGCASHISDLQLVSVSVVDMATEKTENNDLKYLPPGPLVLKVSLQSQTNIDELAEGLGNYVTATAAISPYDKAHELKATPYVYFHGYHMPFHTAHTKAYLKKNFDRPPYFYDFFIYLKSPEWKETREKEVIHSAYDLASNPQDIQFKIFSSGGLTLRELRSNVVVVPKEEIQKALSDVASIENGKTPPQR